MNNCKIEACLYRVNNIPVPGMGVTDLCLAYSKHERQDGLHWAHYPDCSDAECPLRHPELMDDTQRLNKNLREDLK